MTSRPFGRDDVVFFESRTAFRAWLMAHHETAEGLQVAFYRKSTGRPSISYEEAVEEALCFGWIDGVRHAIDDEAYANRFTPRRPGSNWSAVNIRRVESLIEQGLMTAAGLRRFEERDQARAGLSFEQGLEAAYLTLLQAEAAAWDFFSRQPPGYQRLAGLWVMSAKQETTRQRRLLTLIEDSKAGLRIKQLRRPEA